MCCTLEARQQRRRRVSEVRGNGALAVDVHKHVVCGAFADRAGAEHDGLVFVPVNGHKTPVTNTVGVEMPKLLPIIVKIAPPIVGAVCTCV